MENITELLIAAMERHLTNREVESRGVRHYADNTLRDMTIDTISFDLNVNVEVGPLFSCQVFDCSHVLEGPYDLDLGELVEEVEIDSRPHIEAGRYFISRAVETGGGAIDWRDTVHRYEVVMRTVVHPDGSETVAGFYGNIDLQLENGEIYRCLSLIELLALLAAQDARKAGRTKDEEALLSVIPFGTFLEMRANAPARTGGPGITLDQLNEVYSHIEDDLPLLVRGGGKQFTAAMGADTRTKGRVYANSEGITYTRAGRDNGLLIQSVEPGTMVGVDPGTNKLLLQVGNIIVKEGIPTGGETTRVRTNVDELLGARGLQPTRKNRDNIRKQIRALMTMGWSWVDEDGTEHIATISGGGADIQRNGNVELTLSNNFTRLIMNHRAGIVPIDPLLLTTNDGRQRHAFSIGYRLASHTFMNHGKPNECRISVKSILDYVKSLPSYEEVEASDRGHQTDRIIMPLERSLNYLQELGVLDGWDYCHRNGEPLTNEEQALRFDYDGEEASLPYDVAINCLIEWTPKHRFVGAMQAAADARDRNRAAALSAAAESEKESEESKRRVRRQADKIKAQKIAERELSEGN